MDMDFILNGAAHGSIAQRLLATNGNIQVLRPFIGNDGRTYVNTPDGYDKDGNQIYKATVFNSGATLRKNEWQYLDQAVVKAAKQRLKLIGNMRSAGMVVNFPNAYNHSVYQYQRQSDISEARISMNVNSQGENDRVTFDIVNLPLPIIHKEVVMDAREIAIRRNGGQPLDTTVLEQAAERVAETAEKLVLGTLSDYTFGGGTVQGLTNFTYRNTGAFLNHTVSGWTPSMMYNSVIEMMKKATDDYYYGPYDLYYSTGLMSPMLQQFTANYAGGSLINNIKSLPGIASCEMLDYLTGNQLVLVQRSPNTAAVLMGMDLTTVQWSENGGTTEKFRVMAMMIPRLKCDINNNCGIVHYSGNATTAAP